MAEVKLSNVALVATGLSNNDLLLVTANTSNTATTKVIRASDLFGNSTPKIKPAILVLREKSTPANSTITCEEGQLLFDNNYIYIAVANNTLKRVALSSF